LTYFEFRTQLHDFAVFSTRDIQKIFPAFDSKRLVEWQRKRYIQKLINKWYLFTDIQLNEMLLYRISNCLYQPSYVSLESALSYYSLIPEGVYSIQAISTRKTITCQTPVGTFNYRSCKPEFFFGYQILKIDNLPVRMAEIEKAILDYLYLSPNLKSPSDLEALRLDQSTLNTVVNWDKLDTYAKLFGSIALDKKLSNLKKMQSDVNAY
jgi:predicted transcriptional regulator of viral defense system